MSNTLRERFPRTTCACALCGVGCRCLPGALAPEDLVPIAAAVQRDPDDAQFLLDYFEASDGAKVVRRDAFGNVEVFSVPSLVPRLTDTGCIFLRDGRCSIHAVSPAGCALMDMHQDEQTAMPRSQALVEVQMLSHEAHDRYSRAIEQLQAAGQKALPLSERRRRMAKEIARIENSGQAGS